MKLYNSYCYPDISSVADSFSSQLVLGNGSFISSVTFSTQSLFVTTNLNGVFSSYTVTPPDCNRLGFDNSFTGVTTQDAVLYGSLMMSAFVSAYVFKLIKRVL